MQLSEYHSPDQSFEAKFSANYISPVINAQVSEWSSLHQSIGQSAYFLYTFKFFAHNIYMSINNSTLVS